MGPEATRATFRIPEESAVSAAEAHPEYLRVMRRRDARRSYLGLEVRLPQTSGARLYRLVLEAWTARAPRRLVRRYVHDGGRLPRPLGSRSGRRVTIEPVVSSKTDP